MDGWPKTSGGRGLHVYVPIQARWTFVEARRAVIALGRELERRLPDLVTMSWWKEERGQRVFIDYNQMARDRTIASAYSVRPRPRVVYRRVGRLWPGGARNRRGMGVPGRHSCAPAGRRPGPGLHSGGCISIDCSVSRH